MWIFEQTAYLTGGQLNCGYLLDDTFLINKAMKIINYTLDHPVSDGYLGNSVLRKNRWLHSKFFRSLKIDIRIQGIKKFCL